jgi:hypothetical protein
MLMKKLWKLCIDVIEPCVILGIDGGKLFVHDEALFLKLSEGVGELFVHGIELFVHGSALCSEVF